MSQVKAILAHISGWLRPVKTVRVFVSVRGRMRASGDASIDPRALPLGGCHA